MPKYHATHRGKVVSQVGPFYAPKWVRFTSRSPNQSYLQEGVAILELANRAAELFEKQSASEKRRLLDFVLSNSSWGNGELTVEFRQPFDLIAVGATELKQMKAAGVDSDDLHQFKYAGEHRNCS